MSSVREPSRVTGRTVAGVILVLLGILFTLDNFGLVEAGDVFRYWPLLFVAAGGAKLVRARLPEQRFAGVLLAAFGVVLLLQNLDLVRFHFRDVWPFFLVFGGAFLVWRSIRSRDLALDSSSGSSGPPNPTGSVLNEFALMGGGERVIRDPDFRGGEVTAIMGGFDIDLRQAGIAGDSAEITIFALWGGVDLKVPEEWNVVLRGMPILGAFSNSARGGGPPASGAPRKTLVVRGTVIMGGLEVKN